MSLRLTRSLLLALSSIVAAFAASRLFHLTLLPVFLDESLHIYWPTRLFEKGRFLRHLADGKSLQIWLLSPVMGFASDPPWTARLFSILAGALCLGSAFALGRRLYGPSVGLVAAALYTASPFALFYDRMALADVFVSGFAALTLLASVRLAEAPSAGRAAVAGLALSGCVLSKMTGAIFVGVPLLAVWWLRPRMPGAWRALGVTYAVVVALCAFPASYFFSGFQVWSHLFSMVASWLGLSAPPAAHGHGHGHGKGDHLSVILENLSTGGGWLWSYWTAPLFLLGAAGIAVALLKRDRGGMLLAFGAVAPFAAFAILSSHWFPRYIVCSVVPFAVLAARFFVVGVKAAAGPRAAWLGPPLLLLLTLPALRFDYQLLTDPLRAPLPEAERFQYVDGWPSGYGSAEAARYLLAEAQRQASGIVVVADRRAERTVLLILRAYVMNAPRLEMRVVDLVDPGTLAALRQEARQRPLYLALTEPLTEEQRLPNRNELLVGADLSLSCRKPSGAPALDVYRLRGEAPR
jgi:4-amino-4-deoxy-L-arabinose transferase-like glycosyltransferase